MYPDIRCHVCGKPATLLGQAGWGCGVVHAQGLRLPTAEERVQTQRRDDERRERWEMERARRPIGLTPHGPARPPAPLAPHTKEMTMARTITTTTGKDGYDEPYVRYWSVMEQRWRVIYHPQGCPDEDYAALPDSDRALIDALPPPAF